ncbi:RNA polymerase II subunit A C-terminal domain phosphatase isoform X2 [Cydia strobilella]|uniref:RNA polymerase II subunit A C-terminal domain phosphatase isoform X2 n=1 Tax=Cydia strobilella TaxID=1100964 RepID=UPI003005F18F
MADQTVPISVPSEKPLKLTKWKVKEGAFVSQGQILFLYNDSSGQSSETKKYKAVRAGTISCIKVKEGDIAEPGTAIAELEECRHPTVMKEMCAECGADLRTDEVSKRDVAVVPMVHSVPELMVSEELAQKLGREDAERLLKDRKLVLLVDLDQTLVHTTNDNIPPNLKDVLHFFLRGPGSPGRWCHTRLRPRTQEFLESASKHYELHVCTFGARQYAHAIADLLDPEKKYFSHRILSRDECFDPRTKSANLKALFPCGDHMVCIIDDREDVWRHASNLIHVRPYSFFQSTGDINAPPQAMDEKAKLISGKNGSQVSPANQMPTLDPEPEQKKDKESNSDKKEKEETAEKDGDNGKIVNDTDKEDKSEAKEDGEDVADEAQEPKWVETADGQIEVEDPDDYLIYLDDILLRIHKSFYEVYDKMDGKQIPDLKTVIPEVKSKVLEGATLVFSGLVPTHQRLETSRAYLVARSLGAEVTQDFTEKTTHLVAVRSGTAKVHASRRMGEGKNKLHVVTPEWLWACAERWERVDERLYPLQRGGQSSARRPPAHCSSPPPAPPPAPPVAAARKRTASGRFADTINPLLSFSSDDIADMDREVEDIFNESDESSSDDEATGAKDDDLDDEENPPEDRLITLENEDSRLEDTRDGENSSESDTDGESRRKRPRRSPPSDSEPPDDADDDSSWNLMGAALEREFLAE